MAHVPPPAHLHESRQKGAFVSLPMRPRQNRVKFTSVSLRFETEDAARPSRLDVFKDLVAAAVPFVATISLIALNVGVYAVMVVKGHVSPTAPTADALLHWGANYAPLATHGEMWRALTSVFVHVGIVHLLMNMVVLWSAGRIMEPMFGPVDF